MALHNSHSKNMSLNLSSDAKPRLKWTPELHQRFVDAVKQLGGAEKATPKSLMRIMGIHGLTLYHLKSHLQKYRLGRSHHSKPYNQNKQENNGESQRSRSTSKQCDEAHEQNNERTQASRALHLQMEVQRKQMEVQRKLQEQIEVQRHLQLRIEAQGKYLQSVLKKAQQTLSGYGSCSIEVEHAKEQLSQLMSMVDSGPSSSFSGLTDGEGSLLKDTTNKMLGRHNRSSLESSLTSSESSDMKEEITPKLEFDRKFVLNNNDRGTTDSLTLPLMEMDSSKNNGPEIHAMNDKIDLNLSVTDSSPKLIDLNCKGTEL